MAQQLLAGGGNASLISALQVSSTLLGLIFVFSFVLPGQGSATVTTSCCHVSSLVSQTQDSAYSRSAATL